MTNSSLRCSGTPIPNGHCITTETVTGPEQISFKICEENNWQSCFLLDTVVDFFLKVVFLMNRLQKDCFQFWISCLCDHLPDILSLSLALLSDLLSRFKDYLTEDKLRRFVNILDETWQFKASFMKTWHKNVYFQIHQQGIYKTSGQTTLSQYFPAFLGKAPSGATIFKFDLDVTLLWET